MDQVNWTDALGLLGVIAGYFGIARWHGARRETTERILAIALRIAQGLLDVLHAQGRVATADTVDEWTSRFGQAMRALGITPTASQYTEVMDAVRDHIVAETMSRATALLVSRAESLETTLRKLRAPAKGKGNGS